MIQLGLIVWNLMIGISLVWIQSLPVGVAHRSTCVPPTAGVVSPCSIKVMMTPPLSAPTYQPLDVILCNRNSWLCIYVFT